MEQRALPDFFFSFFRKGMMELGEVWDMMLEQMFIS